jgi:penicillin amidase
MNFENKLLLETLLRDTVFSSNSEKNSYQKYFEIMKAWNLSSDVDSIAATIYYSWTREIQVKLLKDLTVDEREVFAKVPNGWIFFKRVVLDPQSPWWKKYDRGSLFKESLTQTIFDLEEKFGKDTKEWQWGKLHTLEFAHPFGRVKPLAAIFNLGPYPAPGATQEVNNQKVSSYKDGFQVKAGPSTRRIIDFSHPEKSWGILPAGNSGHMLSPFYSNQVQKFLGGQYREQLLDPKDKDIRFKLILNPTK